MFQELLAEVYGISQSTVLRVIAAYTPLIAQALQDRVIGCGGPRPHCPADRGRHPPSVLVLEELSRALFRQAQDHWTQRPNRPHPVRRSGLGLKAPRAGGSTDIEGLRRSDLLDVPPEDLPPDGQPPQHIGDKGYIGLGMITPRRKPANLPLHPDDRTCNKTVNQIRYKTKGSSPTSRPGAPCTPTTEDPQTPSQQPSQQSSKSYPHTPYE